MPDEERELKVFATNDAHRVVDAGSSAAAASSAAATKKNANSDPSAQRESDSDSALLRDLAREMRIFRRRLRNIDKSIQTMQTSLTQISAVSARLERFLDEQDVLAEREQNLSLRRGVPIPFHAAHSSRTQRDPHESWLASITGTYPAFARALLLDSSVDGRVGASGRSRSSAGDGSCPATAAGDGDVSGKNKYTGGPGRAQTNCSNATQNSPETDSLEDDSVDGNSV